MLGRLLKYDIKVFTEKYFLILATMAIILLMVVLTNAINILAITGMMFAICVILTFGYIAYLIFNIVSQLHKKMCGRESYLTYTIPAGIKQIVLSKIIAIIFCSIAMLAAIAAFWVAYYNLCSDPYIKGFLDELVTTVKEGGVGRLIMFSVPSRIMFSIFNIVLCASLANVPLFKNRNIGIAVAVIAWFVIEQASGIILAAIWFSYVILSGGNISNEYLNAPENIYLINKVLSNIMAVVYVVLSALLFFISTHIFDKYRSI